MIELARARANDGLCVNVPISILVIDAGRGTAMHSDDLSKIARRSISIAWLFESNLLMDRDPEISTRDKVTYYLRPDSHNQTIVHELGHLIFALLFVPTDPEVDRYGTVAPDWLDEAAALLFESEYSTDARRDLFFDNFEHGDIYSIDSMLTLDHPNLLVAPPGEAYPQRSEQSLVQNSQLLSQVATNGEPEFWNRSQDQLITRQVDRRDVGLFYAQVRVFIDYLIDRTGNRCVVAEIGNAITQGQSFEAWLSDLDTLPRPAPVGDELSEDFTAWATRQLELRQHRTPKF